MEQKNEIKRQRVPLAKAIKVTDFDLFAKYKQLSANKKNHVLLESGRDGKFSIVGLDPWAIITGKNNELTIETTAGVSVRNGQLLHELEAWFRAYCTVYDKSLPEFHGGLIGFLSYDLMRQFEDIEGASIDDLETADLFFLAFDDVIVYDHSSDVLWLITHYSPGQKDIAEQSIKRLEELWLNKAENVECNIIQRRNFLKDKVTENIYSRQFSLSETEFKNAVLKIKKYIKIGDVFQVNLSVRQTEKLRTDPLHIYEKLRLINPSPYMAYFETPSLQIVSGSPELLIKKTENMLYTRPIGGTRPRGENKVDDEQLMQQLLENEKEIAEHVMLVDIERNDLGKVSHYGTVTVDKLMVIEKYSHVMHIVSHIKSKLKKGCNLFDVIYAVFPGGTITGAPKVRTLEIIEELEPVRRGIYTGSIGWIGFNGNMELNIAIRTLVSKGGYAHVQAGAGIVVDSDPSAEYEESLRKAMALWKAKELSEAEADKS